MDHDAAHPRETAGRRPRRGITLTLALFGLATVGLLVAACGGGSTPPGVASAGGTSTTVAPSGSPAPTAPTSRTSAVTSAASGTTPGSSASTSAPPGSPASESSGQVAQSEELQFARCMRAHGVPNFPDPSATGGQLQNIARAGIDTRSPIYQAALQACEGYTPAGHMTPAQRAADQAKGVEFAQCMRAHGVPNFPDPTTGPTGAPAINLGPEHIDPASPTYQAANQACQRIVPGAK